MISFGSSTEVPNSRMRASGRPSHPCRSTLHTISLMPAAGAGCVRWRYRRERGGGTGSIPGFCLLRATEVRMLMLLSVLPISSCRSRERRVRSCST